MGVDVVIYFETDRQLSAEEFADYCYRLRDSFDDSVHIYRKDYKEDGEIESHCVEQVAQDDLLVDDELIGLTDGDRHLYTVNTMMRYYGPGYERGAWPIISGICEWLLLQPRVVDVWYGGDCNGRVMVYKEIKAELWEHFAQHGHLPYLFYGRGATYSCPDCGGKMWEQGSGGGSKIFLCPGCGKHLNVSYGDVSSVISDGLETKRQGD